jgi:hypothetical protein
LFQTLFSIDDQWRLLNKINLLNSASCLILFLVARPFCRKNATASAAVDGIAQITALISPLRTPLLLLSFPIVLILFAASFPEPENPVWRTPFLLMEAVADSAILICGVQWSKLSLLEKCIALVLIASLSWIGILRLSKLDALLPVAAWLGGLMLDTRSSVRLIVTAAITVIVAFLVLAILANSSRGNYAYRPNNTRAERFAIVSDTTRLAYTAVTSSAQGSSDTLQLALAVLNRFGDAPIQAFLINRYDTGIPGETLQGAWQILIPRVIWPGKPDISHYGLDLDAAMTDRKTTTFLGPTFTAEAYWNGGWLYVLLVSIFLGLEVGWFTHKWNRFRDEGLSQVGSLIFAVPIIANITLLETWFALTYVGLAAGLVALVYVGDALGPLLARLLGTRAMVATVPASANSQPGQ